MTRSLLESKVHSSDEDMYEIRTFPPTVRKNPKPRRTFYKSRVENKSFTVEDRYQNLKYLGQGSYGTVCSAYDETLNCLVAIKKIANVFKVVTDAKRTLREIRILRHLGSHDNIVSLLDFTVMPNDAKTFDDVYLIMEKWPCDLDRIISSRQQLSNQHLQLFTYQIVKAVKFMHAAKVVHRDLKPSNILVDSECHLVLCDFGLARGLTESSLSHKIFDNYEETDGNLTEYVVTRWYRSPELLAENSKYPCQADVWSIGCILAELFLRKPLFPGKSQAHQLQIIFELLGKPPILSLEKYFCTSAVRAVKEMNIDARSNGLEKRFKEADLNLLGFLRCCFIYDPKRRKTIKELFDHPYLDELRDADDTEIEHMMKFDSSFELHFKQKDISQTLLRGLFLETHYEYHPKDRSCFKAASSLLSLSRVENEDPNFL